MKRITRTIKKYRYTIYAVTIENGAPAMEALCFGFTFDEFPKEKAIVAEYRGDFPDEKRALVIVVDSETEQKYGMSIEKFMREAEEI